MRRRRTAPPPSGTPDRWLLSYADLLTLLFALFVVLFAVRQQNHRVFQRVSGVIHSGFSSLGAAPLRPKPLPVSLVRSKLAAPGSAVAALVPEQGVADGSRRDSPLPALAAQLQQAFATSIAQGAIGLRTTSEGLVISLRETGFFDSGEAQLLPGAAATMIRIGNLLKQRGLQIRVEGHSDDQPIHTAAFRSNWELSAARAMTVLLLLVDSVHYDPRLVSMAGYGAYRPVASNATAAGRRLNRRVDLVVLGP